MFDRLTFGFIIEYRLPFVLEVSSLDEILNLIRFIVIALAGLRRHVAELNRRSVLSDRNAYRPVIFVNVLRIMPAHPRNGVLVLDRALRPLRFNYFKSFRKFFGYVIVITRIKRLIACAAAVRRYTRDKRFAVGRKPDIVVLFRLIERIVNLLSSRSALGVGIEHYLRNFKALFLELYKRFDNELSHVRINGGVGRVEAKVIYARHSEKFHMTSYYPRIGHRVITVKRLRAKMKFAHFRKLAVGLRIKSCRSLFRR